MKADIGRDDYMVRNGMLTIRYAWVITAFEIGDDEGYSQKKTSEFGEEQAARCESDLRTNKETKRRKNKGGGNARLEETGGKQRQNKPLKKG